MTTQNRIRLTPIRLKGAAPELTAVQFTFSGDLIEALFAFHDKLFRAYGFSPEPWHRRWRYHRLEYGRLHDMGLSSILVRIEAPSFDPHGAHFRPYGKQYLSSISARKLRLRPDLPIQNLAFILDEALRGLLITFRDEDMQPAEEIELRKGQKAIPVDDNNMAVHRYENRR